MIEQLYLRGQMNWCIEMFLHTSLSLSLAHLKLTFGIQPLDLDVRGTIVFILSISFLSICSLSAQLSFSEMVETC